MQGKKPYDAPRVHVRALARLQQLHEEISSGRYPSIADLAVSTGRTSRTIKRDVQALRGDFKAPLVYDRHRLGEGRLVVLVRSVADGRVRLCGGCAGQV